MTTPHERVRMPRYVEGRLNFFRRMLLGTSNRTYGMKTGAGQQAGSSLSNRGRLTDRQDSVVLDTRHAQVFHHALNLGVANVGSVDVADQVEQSQHGHKTDVHLGNISL
jgi:hypothetical protein